LDDELHAVVSDCSGRFQILRIPDPGGRIVSAMETQPSDLAIPERKRHPLVWGCGALLLLLLLIFATVAVTLWWSQRPIRPVVLSPQEKTTVEEKIKEIGGGTIPLNTDSMAVQAPAPAGNPVADSRSYVPGSKVLRLSEREVNGLLNLNTELGDKVHLEFSRDAINAYLAIPVPQDFPIGAGTIFRMRGRFSVSIGGEGKPYAVLEDVTIFGLSLPKAWLGGIKGENLLGDALGGGPVAEGIKSLKVEPGELVLEVWD